MIIKRCRVLIGAGEIMEYLRCSKALLKTFLDLGMPAEKISGRWYAHTENIDAFFKVRTYKNAAGLSEDELDENHNGGDHGKKKHKNH